MNTIFSTTLALLLLLAGQAAIAEQPNAQDVEAWADALFATALSEKRMSGAVLTMVQGGEIVLSKGFGYADYFAKTPVLPDDTRFRIGSNTKTFTALAIAQLLDDGRIKSLDDPANQYLKRLQLPTVDGVDITLAHLITHSAGFENRVFNIGTDKSVELPLSSAEIDRFASVVVNTPGKYSSYNNYGTTVLGLIVEDVSSQAIADYFDEHIFAPLGMTKSILNMSPEPSEGLGVPYGFLPNGDALEIKHRTVHPFFAPVGGINATGDDMGRYMLAQLAEGNGENPILSHDGYVQMHTQIRTNHPLSSGFGMIYFTWQWNDERLYIHGGDWPGTHSGMVMMPDSDTALFFSLMADYPDIPILESIIGSERMQEVEGVAIDTPISNVGVIMDFLTTFVGEYEKPVNAPFTPTDMNDYVGSYVGQSAPVSTMERLLAFTNTFLIVNVAVSGDSTGLMINDVGPYQEIGAGVFWSDSVSTPLDGFFLNSRIFNFVRDADGNVDYLTPQIGFDAWVKSSSLENPQTYATIWGLAFVILLTSVISMFYPSIANQQLAKWMPSIIFLLLIAMPLILIVGYPEGSTVVDELFFGRTGRFTAFAVTANIIALCSIYLAWQVYLAWRDKYWRDSRAGIVLRIHYSILGIAALLFIPVFSFLNMLAV